MQAGPLSSAFRSINRNAVCLAQLAIRGPGAVFPTIGGRRVLDAPATPKRVLAAIEEVRERGA